MVVLHLLDFLDTVDHVVASVPVGVVADDAGSGWVMEVVDSEGEAGFPVSTGDEVFGPDLALDEGLGFGLGDKEEFSAEGVAESVFLAVF